MLLRRERQKACAVVGRDAGAGHSLSIDRCLNTLETVLATMANCDTGMASAILFKALSRPGLKHMRKLFLVPLKPAERNGF
jgi:hypothetical protein